MNKIFSSPLFSKILSVILAIIIWFFVTYTQDPEINKKVTDVPIVYNGVESLTKNGLAIVRDVKPKTVSVNLVGKRSGIINISGKITAGVDVSTIVTPSTTALPLAFHIPNDTVRLANNNAIKSDVNIDVLETSTMPIIVKQIGKKQNDTLVKTTLKTDKISISGPKSIINKIKSAVINVDISNITNGENVYPVVLLDNDDKIVTRESLSLSRDAITVVNTIYQAKTLPILPSIASSNIYSVKTANTVPQSIVVGVLDGQSITSVTTSPPIVLSSEGNQSYTVALSVPDNAYLPEGTNVVVNLEVVKK